MLKGIDRALSAEMLMVLMSGDDILVCDVNHPAAAIAKQTAYGQLVNMVGCDIPRAIQALLSLMPLDTFVESPVKHMAVVGDADRIMPIHERVQATVNDLEGGLFHRSPWSLRFLGGRTEMFCCRQDIRSRSVWLFILRKGVIEASSLP